MTLPTNRTTANTAAEHVADHNTAHGLLNNLDAAWTSYTPTLTQLGTVTATVTYAKYIQIGKTVSFALNLTVTGSGTAANEVTVSLPVAAATNNLLSGVGLIYDSSASTLYNGNATLLTTTTAALYPSTDGAATRLGVRVFTAALASGDLVRITGTYETA